MTWVRFLGYAAFSALGRVYQVVILDKILSWKCTVLRATMQASKLPDVSETEAMLENQGQRMCQDKEAVTLQKQGGD
jgi:hypothetical protein